MSKEMVNHPSHYNRGNYEVIDILEDQLTEEQYKGFLLGNVLKYTMRYHSKDGIQDLKKASWYLNKLITYEDENPTTLENKGE